MSWTPKVGMVVERISNSDVVHRGIVKGYRTIITRVNSSNDFIVKDEKSRDYGCIRSFWKPVE